MTTKMFDSAARQLYLMQDGEFITCQESDIVAACCRTWCMHVVMALQPCSREARSAKQGRTLDTQSHLARVPCL